jgi:hypothetical protein
MRHTKPQLQPLPAGQPPPHGAELVRRIEADLPSLSPKLRNVARHLVRDHAVMHRQRITDVADATGTACRWRGPRPPGCAAGGLCGRVARHDGRHRRRC